MGGIIKINSNKLAKYIKTSSKEDKISLAVSDSEQDNITIQLDLA